MSANAIDELSQGIERAVAEITRLRRENARLAEKAAKLEKSLEEVPEEAAADSGERQAWLDERQEIRSHVADLVSRLERAVEG